VFFLNTRFRFKVHQLPTSIPGWIIAASAISPVDLQRRPLKNHPHLTRRLLDPQLYMASLDPAIDPQTVGKLAAYPWFHGQRAPKYDSGQYVSRDAWKKKHVPDLVSQWTRTVATDLREIRKAARAAVEFQQKMGCEGILLAAPLTTIVDQTMQNELQWIDAGLEACSDLKVTLPVFATIALSEGVLQVPPLKNPIIHSISNGVTARSELAGAHIVLEELDPDSYFWNSKDALMSLMILVDDLRRGAKKKAIVNYVGTFGLVATAAGAEIWSSGYYLMQRRFSLRGKSGRAHPRYHSMALAGDIGLKDDLGRLQRAGLAEALMSHSRAEQVLRKALQNGKTPSDVPEWAYKQSNCTAAQQHYLEVVSEAGSNLERMSQIDRTNWVEQWLKKAVEFVIKLKEKQLVGVTDVDHQKVWFDVFESWRAYAKQ
jgi:hypothetical protein